MIVKRLDGEIPTALMKWYDPDLSIEDYQEIDLEHWDAFIKSMKPALLNRLKSMTRAKAISWWNQTVKNEGKLMRKWEDERNLFFGITKPDDEMKTFPWRNLPLIKAGSKGDLPEDGIYIFKVGQTKPSFKYPSGGEKMRKPVDPRMGPDKLNLLALQKITKNKNVSVPEFQKKKKKKNKKEWVKDCLECFEEEKETGVKGGAVKRDAFYYPRGWTRTTGDGIGSPYVLHDVTGEYKDDKTRFYKFSGMEGPIMKLNDIIDWYRSTYGSDMREIYDWRIERDGLAKTVEWWNRVAAIEDDVEERYIKEFLLMHGYDGIPEDVRGPYARQRIDKSGKPIKVKKKIRKKYKQPSGGSPLKLIDVRNTDKVKAKNGLSEIKKFRNSEERKKVRRRMNGFRCNLCLERKRIRKQKQRK